MHGRDRDSIVEGENEKVNPKYQKLVEDYFKSLTRIQFNGEHQRCTTQCAHR